MNHILIVDDHADIRRLLSITLGKQHNIVEAVNGITALEAVQKYHPKIVLLDVMMPGTLDGLQVLHAIKSNPETRDILVAIITARGSISNDELTKNYQADAYFTKPFSPLEVANWVESHIG